MDYSQIKNNIDDVLNKVNIAAKMFGRDPSQIKVLAATKTVCADKINFACRNGIKIIGENRVQELLEKYDGLDKSIMSIHFIGNLQTNKVKYIADKVDMIHSVNSIKLAAEIDKQCKKIGKVMDVLLEINIGHEETKSGIMPEEVYNILSEIAKFENIRVCGLMAIPPAPVLGENFEKEAAENDKKTQNSQIICNSNEYFEKIQQLFLDIYEKKLDNIYMQDLSLGMSNDFCEAIKYGSTIIRPGSCIFGKRIYKK